MPVTKHIEALQHSAHVSAAKELQIFHQDLSNQMKDGQFVFSGRSLIIAGGGVRTALQQ